MKKIFGLAVLSALAVVSPAAMAALAITPTNDTALGTNASAIGNNNVAVGGDTSANGSHNTNINGILPYAGVTSLNEQGIAASAPSGNGVAVINPYATVLGNGATAYSTSPSYPAGTAIGSFAASSGPNTAIGSGAQAGPASTSSSTAPSNDTAIGGSIFSGSSNVAIGGGTVYNGSGNIAEGENATSSGSGSVAIGNGATAGKPSVFLDPSTAVGSGATATGTDSEAYGYNAQATATNAEALGTGAQAGQPNSVALGSGSTANTEQTGQGSAVTIRGQTYNLAGGSPSGEVSVGSASGGTTRLITNVAAGQISSTSTQAVNGSELYATNQAIDNLQTMQSSQGVLHYTTSNGATSTTPTSTVIAGSATTGPVTISNVGNGTIAHGSTTVANGNDVWEAEQGALADANAAQTNAEGYAGQIASIDSAQTLQSANAESDKVGSVDASLAAASAEAAAGKHRNTIAGGTAEYNGQASFAFAYQHRFGTHWASMFTVGSNGTAANTTVAGAASYSW